MFNKPKNHLKSFAIGALIAALGAGSYVIAAITFSDFTTGTTISASEMNAKLYRGCGTGLALLRRLE